MKPNSNLSMTPPRHTSHGLTHFARRFRSLATIALVGIAIAATFSQPLFAGGHGRGHDKHDMHGMQGKLDAVGGGNGTGAGPGYGDHGSHGTGFGTGSGGGARGGLGGGYGLPPTSNHDWTSGFPTCPPPVAPPAAWQRFFMLYNQYEQTVAIHRLPFAVWLVTHTPSIDAKTFTLYMQMYTWYEKYVDTPRRGRGGYPAR